MNREEIMELAARIERQDLEFKSEGGYLSDDDSAMIVAALRAQGEPVAWQWRSHHPNLKMGWSDWFETTEENAKLYGEDKNVEVRALAALPSSPALLTAPQNTAERLPSSDAAGGAGEAIFSECAEIAMGHAGSSSCTLDTIVGKYARSGYDEACRDIAESIRTRASNRKTMDAIADAKVIDLQRKKAELVKALETISAASPIETGAERLRCRQCGHAWLPDEQEHHGKHCAYQVARAALALVKP